MKQIRCDIIRKTARDIPDVDRENRSEDQEIMAIESSVKTRSQKLDNADHSAKHRSRDIAGMKRLLSMALLAIFLLAAVWFIHKNWNQFQNLRFVSPGFLLIISFLFVINMGLRGLFSLHILKVFSVNLSLVECFFLSTVTTMTNFLLPLRGGAGYRAVYLKKYHQLPYTYFLSTMAALYVLFIIVNTGLGILALGAIRFFGGPMDLTLLAIICSVFVLTSGSIFIAPGWIGGDGPVTSKLQRIATGWDQIRTSRKTMAIAILTVLGSSICATAGFYVGFAAFSLERTIPGALLLTASQNIGQMINLTPGALGFQELAGLYFGRVLETTLAQTFAVIVTVKLIKVLTSIVFGMPGLWILRPGKDASTPR